MTKLLLVEDEKDFAFAVKDWLGGQGYLVDLAHSGPEAVGCLRAGEYDLIILDWNLPGLSGIDVCKSFRGQGGRTPVIMLTGNRALDEKETGFDSGADDYLTKPFHMRELSMRVKALLRRSSPAADDVLTVRDIALQPDEHRVMRNGVEVNLLPKEFSLLEFFIRNPGKVFSAEALIQRVWATESDASPDTIRSYITRLRQKLSTDDNERPLIVTVHGVGYRLDP